MHTLLGYLPEQKLYILRNGTSEHVELWRISQGTSSLAIPFRGVILEHVRDALSAHRVIDNEYNRRWHLDEIGRIYVDDLITGALTQEL